MLSFRALVISQQMWNFSLGIQILKSASWMSRGQCSVVWYLARDRDTFTERSSLKSTTGTLCLRPIS